MNTYGNLSRKDLIFAIIFIFKSSTKTVIIIILQSITEHNTIDLENQFPTFSKTHWSCDQFQICWPFEIFLVNPEQYAKKKTKTRLPPNLNVFVFEYNAYNSSYRASRITIKKWLVSRMNWLKRDRILIRIIKHINHTVDTIKIIMVVITTIHLEDLIQMEEDLKVQELRLKTA